MTDEQIRITVLTEMFLGLGHEPTPERIAYYVRLTKNVPTKYLRVACDSAVSKSTTGFPATPGQIIHEAEFIHMGLRKRESKAAAVEAWTAHEASLGQAEPESPDEIAQLIDLSLRKAGA